MKFVFDCDDTLLVAIPEIYLTALRFAETNIPHFSEWQCGIEQPWINDIEEWKAFMILDKVLERIQLAQGARHLLHRLHELGHEVIIMTNRGFHPHAFDITRHALGFTPYTDLVILPFDACKAEAIAQRYGKVDVFVDDSAKHCENALNLSVATSIYQPSLPQSRTVEGVQRIHDVTQLFNILNLYGK
jgi:FMN phosphatase YigB (HAD superfamily)